MRRVVALPFDRKMCAMAWDDFLDMLMEAHDAAGFVCGEDFRFGYQGKGTAEHLADYCRQRDLPWAVVPEQLCRGQRISSTHIRRLLEQGDIEQAAEFLCCPSVRGIFPHRLRRQRQGRSRWSVRRSANR